MKKVLIIIGIIAVITVLVLASVMNKGEGGLMSGGKGLPVKTEIVEKGDLSSTVLVTGAVKEVNKKDMVAPGAIEITSINVDVGTKVTKGEKLYTVDTTGIEDELIQLRLNREVTALQMEKTQNVSMTSSSTGMKVAVEMAKLDLTSAESAYETHLENFDKNKALFDEGIISSSELDGLSGLVEDAASRVEVAKLSLERSESDLNQIYTSNSTTNKSLEYDVAIQLKNLEMMDLSIAKLEKQLIESDESTMAPMTGVVTEVHIDQGDIVMQNSPLFQIIDMEELIVEATVREYDIRTMEVGQSVVITGDAVSKDKEILGELSYISPVASSGVVNGREATGIEIKIEITKGMESLKPGFTMDCDVTTEKLENIVIGSFNMYREDIDNNKVAYVVVDGLVEERAIEIGIVSDFESEIVSGLDEGDEVVMNPSLALKDGSAVEVDNEKEEEGM